MTKFRKSLLIFGILALIIGAALGTFVVLSLTGSLKAEPIALEFTVDDADKTYDGEALIASSYSITDGYLVEGHTPVVTFTGGQTDVGVGTSGLDVKIINEDGYDVTDQYKIKVNGGKLQVGPCAVTIAVTSQDVIYDGTAVDIGNDYAVGGGNLAKGHRVSLEIRDAWFENAGKTVAGNTLTAEDVTPLVLDSNGRDVTGNYSIALLCRVRIIKRPLIIYPVSAEKTYDGKPLECSDYRIESGSLASGHYIAATYETEIGGMAAKLTDVNSLEIIANATIYDINGDDVTDNYDLKSNVGYLTVNKAPLTIVAMSKSWKYDGNTHSLSDETLPDSVYGLVNGEEVKVTYSGNVDGIGASENIIVSYSVTDLNSQIDKKDNYAVTLKEGTLEITKAPLTVTLNSLEKEYDGEPFEKSVAEVCTVTSTINNLQLQFNDEEYLKNLFKDVTEIGNTTYTVSDFKIFNGADDVTDKFDITVVPGNLKINRCKVSLVQKEDSKLTEEYDGNFTFDSGISLDKFLPGHRIASFSCEPASSVGENKMKLTSLSLVDSKGFNVLGYYNIENLTTFTASIKVTPKKIKVYLESFEIEYNENGIDGITLSNHIICEGASSENFAVQNDPFKGIGTHTVEFEWKGFSSQDNYDIEYGNKEFEIVKRKRTSEVNAESAQKTYNAKAITKSDLALNVIGGESLSAEDKNDFSLVSSNLLGIVDAGVYDAEIIYETAVEVLTLTGQYKINQLTVKIIANKTLEKTYDGLPYVVDVDDLSVTDLNGKAQNFLTVNNYKSTDKIFEATTGQQLTFKSIELIIDTGEAVNPDNVKIDCTKSSVNVKINKRTLSISLDPINCSSSNISKLNSSDLTGIINYSNLVDGDVVQYRYVNQDGTWGDVNKTRYNVVTVSASATISVLYGNKIQILNKDGVDVTKSYDIPSQVNGAVIVS